MDYKKKVEYATRIAEELQGTKSREQVKEELKAEGFYDRDISSILSSADKILEEKYLPEIKKCVLADEAVQGQKAFEHLDSDLLSDLENEVRLRLAKKEQQKYISFFKNGLTIEQILPRVDYRFVKKEKVLEDLKAIQEQKTETSAPARMINITIGIGLILLSVVLFFVTQRLFYVMPIIGLGMIIKGVVGGLFQD